ncbi:MAG: GNAT family N-acetyltransferase [Bacteroidetes bacterium]|nr:GNAT family N-acetyltransferase [Bacteroidota bacterium]
MLNIRFTPFPVLETERLLLRCINFEDAQQLFALRSDPNIMKYLDRKPFKTIDEAITFIREKILDNLHRNDGILWVIEMKDQPGKMIGSTGFWRLDKEHYRAEIGYMLHSDYWRKGIMKEAILVTIQWLFSQTDVHSIEANINPENEPSAAILKSIGFEQEAYFKENYYFNGQFKDSAIYSYVKGIHFK